MRVLLLLLLLTACATPTRIMVPHVCVPSRDSPAFQKCKADCEGDAFIVENAADTACYCRKPPEGT